MAVTGVWSSAGVIASDGLFVGGLGSFPGHRLLVVVGDRGGGVTCTVSADDEALAAALAQVAERVTLPESTSDRRSVWLWSAVVPEGAATNPRLLITVIDSDANVVDASAVAFAVDDGRQYQFAAAAAADSGATTTTSQTTGTTGTVPAGDWLIVTAATVRGAATTAWAVTTGTPDNPGGGTWDLSVGSGSGAARREVRAGVAELAARPQATVSDTLTLDTARMTSALIAAWSTGASDGGEVTGAGVLEAPAATVAGEGAVLVSGAGGVQAPPAAVGGAGTVLVTGAGAAMAPAALVSGAAVHGTVQLPPVERTLAVEVESRVLLVEAESRRVLVA